MNSIIIGIDLGQVADFTAICEIDVTPQANRGKPLVAVRYLHRFRRVAYPVVIDHIAAMADWPVLQGATFVVDPGGAGRPVSDAVRERVGTTVGRVTGRCFGC